MGLHSPCVLATTVTALEAADIAVVQRDNEWFIEFAQRTLGPYATPELALEASVRWLTAMQKRQIGRQAEG